MFDRIAKVYKVVAIVGARQSGKTTLLRKKLEEYGGSYVSFDDPDVREMFNTDVKKFEKQYIAENKFTGLEILELNKFLRKIGRRGSYKRFVYRKKSYKSKYVEVKTSPTTPLSKLQKKMKRKRKNYRVWRGFDLSI